MSEQNVFDEMNVLLAVPVDTVYMVCTVEYMDDTGPKKASAVYQPEDLHRAYAWFEFCQDTYYADHRIGDDVDEYPIIWSLPDTAYKAAIRFGRGAFRDVSAETGGLCDRGWVWQKDIVYDLTLSDIKRMRKDFLKYIPDGDDYGVYVLTEKGLRGLEDDGTGKEQAAW